MSFSAREAAQERYASLRCIAPALLLNYFAKLRQRRRKNSAGIHFLILFVYLLLPAPVLATIVIEPRVGFHGVFQLGRPFPLEIELSNTGRPAEGMLEVRVWKGGATKGGAPYVVNYQRAVFLAAQARKSVQLTIDPDFISRPVKITFSGAETAVSRELDLRRYFSPRRCYCS